MRVWVGLGTRAVRRYTHADTPAPTGNCPKYINSKRIVPFAGVPSAQPDTPTLSPEARALIARADLFFIATSNGAIDMDCNHRGGPTGFVRALPDAADGGDDVKANAASQIIWPEYSGNRLYSTLGNLQSTPRAGLVIPDFETGDVLYLTGTTKTLVGKRAAAVLPRSNLAVLLTIEVARFVRAGLTFRGIPTEASPYNPPVRPLASESKIGAALTAAQTHTARLVSRTRITPRITRYRFSLDGGGAHILRGQWVALDLADQLDQGYSHMRDSAPLSLNDDYVRTFTVSRADWDAGASVSEFEVTVRREGTVTAFMQDAPERRLNAVGVRGFGGDFSIECAEGAVTPFVTGGVGITPVLAQLGAIPLASFRLLWTVRADEIGLVADTFARHPDLAASTDLFLTGDASGLDGDGQAHVRAVTALARNITHRRLNQADLAGLDAPTWYLCTGNALRQTLLDWLVGKKVIYESFDY